jgi:hypothetical protein
VNDERVIALLKESVPVVPDVPSRVSSVRSLASRQRTYARLQALGAAASVVLVVAGITAVARAGGGDRVRPVGNPVARMAFAFSRQESVSFETRVTANGHHASTHGSVRGHDLVSYGGLLTPLSEVEPETEYRIVGGKGYQSILPGDPAPPGVSWKSMTITGETGADPFAFAAEALRKGLSGVRYSAQGEVRGVPVARYTAYLRVGGDAHAATLTFALDGDGLPRQVAVDGPESIFGGDRADRIHMEVDLFGYGHVAPIVAPRPQEVIDPEALGHWIADHPATSPGGCSIENGVPTQADADACAAYEQGRRPAGVTCRGILDGSTIDVECSDGKAFSFGSDESSTP